MVAHLFLKKKESSRCNGECRRIFSYADRNQRVPFDACSLRPKAFQNLLYVYVGPLNAGIQSG